MGDRRAQVAERPVRLRGRVHRAPESHSGAFSARAAYLVVRRGHARAIDWNPEPSRRARAFPVYAAIRSLGRERDRRADRALLRHARAFADGIEQLGAEVLNDVVLNQVLFRFTTDEETTRAQAVQASGEAWMGGTTWDGRPAIRISVSNWQTTEADIDRTLAAYAGQRAAR